MKILSKLLNHRISPNAFIRIGILEDWVIAHDLVRVDELESAKRLQAEIDKRIALLEQQVRLPLTLHELEESGSGGKQRA